jgi:hypothetical protein
MTPTNLTFKEISRFGKKRATKVPSLELTPSRAFALSLGLAALAFILSSPDVLAVDADGEMGASTKRIDTLLNKNIMHTVMGAGIASSVIYSFYKSSFVPVGVGVGAGVLYGFSRTWIDAVFAVCI